MDTYIALLRGINISGQKKIIMKDLVLHMEDIGLKEVISYIQSGNLVFKSEFTIDELKEKIENKIKKEYDFHVPVKLIIPEDLKDIISNNPYLRKDNDPKFMYITYLFETPDREKAEDIKDFTFNEDEFKILTDCVYVYCPGGAGKTKITNNYFENKLKVQATSRNWKTTLKLLELSKS